ncbi:Phosphotyrosyl phosphatase activator [Scheffersomyces xylosifermentans]|uniref:Phosphotyrosyl phosphatase activator n=1 Tax=Scheffersomyces xylosifermentans TaxID=1304137 RepID=UPI00315D6CFF
MTPIDRQRWAEPSKRIFGESDLVYFKKSKAYHRLIHLLKSVVEKIKGTPLPQGILNAELTTRKKSGGNSHLLSSVAANTRRTLVPIPQERTIPVESIQQNTTRTPHEQKNFDGLLNVIEALNSLIDETPPLSGPRRFGNLACRQWHDKVHGKIQSLFDENLELPPGLDRNGFFLELNSYFLNSFGSKLRLDYGTGHEFSFLAFLGGLFEFELLEFNSLPAVDLLTIFAKYYDLCRRLIIDYNLEPAGSRGVWGLDDHFHLIYILGAAQFNDDKSAPPVQQVLSSQVINSHKTSNLYVNAIAFIYRIKSGPFNEHSPIIYDIHTTVSLWAKVLQGLLRMYDVEVLGKFPVVQHFWFGDVLYPWIDNETKKELPINIREEKQDKEEDNEPGLLSGFRGVNTTRANVSMTGAPWANKQQQQPPPTRLPHIINRK